jgi:dUTP pyrophosphatase
VIAINHGTEPFRVQHGDRIAQLVVAAVIQPIVIESDVLEDTERGEGGFGSTGVS